MDLQRNSTPPSPPPKFDTTHNLLNSSTFLLHLIEPVRIYIPQSPSPVSFSGTGRGNDDNNSSEKLKRRLIDALAFICATEREGDSGAAVCIEEAIIPEVEDARARDENLTLEHGGYTLRIAKNGWIGGEVLQGVRDIIKSLEAFADGCKLSLFYSCQQCLIPPQSLQPKKEITGFLHSPTDNTQSLLRKFMINKFVCNFKLQAQAPP